MTSIPPIASSIAPTPTTPSPNPSANTPTPTPQNQAQNTPQNAQQSAQTPPAKGAENKPTPPPTQNNPQQNTAQPQPQPNAPPQAQQPPKTPTAPLPNLPLNTPSIPAQVVQTSPTLANHIPHQPVRADLVALNDDGTLTLSTPRGEVTLRLPPNTPQNIIQTLTQAGVRVVLTMPTYPSTNAQITPYLPSDESPTYTTISGQTPQTVKTTPNALLQFLKNTLQGVINTGTNAANALHPITTGQLVRLIPITSGTFQNISIATNGQTTTLPQITSTWALPTLNRPSDQSLTIPLLSAAKNAANIMTAKIWGMPATNAANIVSSNLTPTITSPMTNLMGTLQTNLQTSALKTQILDAKILQIVPQIMTTSAPTPALANLLHGTPQTPVILAQIIGATPNHLPVMTMPATNSLTVQANTLQPMQTLTLQFPATGLPQGGFVQLGVLQSMPAPSFGTPIPLWEALDDLVGAINTNPATQAQNLAHLQAMLPKPGSAAFAAPVLLFIAAARGGDISAWMGERLTDNIRNTKRLDVLTRLSSALSSAAPADDNAPASEWRAMPLPFLSDNEINRLMLHYRYFERDGENKGDDKQIGTRFVLDLSLTHMGDMQVDGLSFGKQLDVTLRSKHPFSPAMRQAMRMQYTHALEGIGYAGLLNFASDENWVDFSVEITATSQSRSQLPQHQTQ